MLCCTGCRSRFFKTLELRFELLKNQVKSILYKKRCKRCKQICLIELTAVGGQAHYDFVSYERWQLAKQSYDGVPVYMQTVKSPIVSEYTLLISSNTSKIFDKLLHKR